MYWCNGQGNYVAFVCTVFVPSTSRPWLGRHEYDVLLHSASSISLLPKVRILLTGERFRQYATTSVHGTVKFVSFIGLMHPSKNFQEKSFQQRRLDAF